MGNFPWLELEFDCVGRITIPGTLGCSIIRVRGEPSERLIPSLGVDMGPGGDKFSIIILFAGPRAGPLYFDTQAPRRPRPTRKVTPRLGLEVLLVKHQDLAVAGGC